MKKIKLPLEMANGVMVRSLDELKENWDLEKIVGYFGDGRLVTWLNDRYYTDLAERVQKITAIGAEAQKQLCAVFGMEFKQDEVVDAEAVAERKRKLDILRQFTSDDEVLKNIDHVAFNQEDLADLLDDDTVQKIYLFNSRFHIPLSVRNKTYVGVGNVTVLIGENHEFNVSNLGLKFENVKFEGEHAIGMRKIGLMYRFGEGVGQDYQKALEWFEKAWDMGDIVAARSIAFMYRDGLGITQSNEKYLIWMKKAVEKGHIGTMSALGLNYLDGEYVSKDYNEAMKYFRVAADKGDSFAMEMIGYMNHFACGIDRNDVEAFVWYEKAANLGNGKAAWRTALAYEKGEGVDKSLEKAFEWYEKACSLGYSGAYSNVARFYKNGIGGVSVNFEKAYSYYEKGMFVGNSFCAYNLAEMCKNGEGVECNVDKAIEFYKKAIDLGDNSCYSYIGSIYRYGVGETDKNLEKALEWFEKGVDAGDEDCRSQAEEVKKELSYGSGIKPGDEVDFGRYGGEPIRWIMLGKDDDGTWLMSEGGIDAQPFNHGKYFGRKDLSNLSVVERIEANTSYGRGAVEIDWQSSTLRQWLNGEFCLVAFNDNEKGKLVANSAGDKVALLTVDEARQAAQAGYVMRCKASEYASKRGANVDGNGYGSWWLASGSKMVFSPAVNSSGEILSLGINVDDEGVLVRPVICVKL